LPALKAITLDLWGTILYPKDADEKIERRRAMVLEALLESGLQIDFPALGRAYQTAHKMIEENIGKEFRDLGPQGRWSILTQQLGLPPGVVPYSRVAAAYEELTLEYLPPLMPGVAGAIERLHGDYQLALICNTGYTGGKVLREVLQRHGLRDYFQSLVFSNEFGWLKPEPRIFQHALRQLAADRGEAVHVGDSEELDVGGARAAGMLAARYLPDGPAPSEAHLVFHDWAEFESQLVDLCQNSSLLEARTANSR